MDIRKKHYSSTLGLLTLIFVLVDCQRDFSAQWLVFWICLLLAIRFSRCFCPVTVADFVNFFVSRQARASARTSQMSILALSVSRFRECYCHTPFD